MDPARLAILCHDKLGVGLRDAMLDRLRSGRAPLDLLPQDSGGQGAALRRALDPGSEESERWRRLSRDLAAGRLSLLRPGMAHYPPCLAALTRPPDPLFCQGRLSLLRGEGVAVVGTRQPDARAVDWTRRIATRLARLGFVVVSGGAAGIDAAAHGAAGCARTVAVLGSGFDRPYPGCHVDLFARIAAEGLLVSEWPPWTRPETWRFPRRNRVIAGLSRAVIVAQAPLRSGALSTAHHAVEEGREVLVCPGPADHPLFAGSHRLIREGARLCATDEHLREDLGGLPLCLPLPAPAPTPSVDGMPDLEQGADDGGGRDDAAAQADPLLWQALETPCDMDRLAGRLGLDPSELAARLLEGELAGRLRALPGDRWARHTWTGV
ncbi:MAG: DNA-processing protein DprA [bacterium]|jgi:DNA processing protein|nr:DNA-processing protein DprA [bacterium]